MTLRGGEIAGSAATAITAIYGAITAQEWNVLIIPIAVGIVSIFCALIRAFSISLTERGRRRIDEANAYTAAMDAQMKRDELCRACVSSNRKPKTCSVRQYDRQDDCPLWHRNTKKEKMKEKKLTSNKSIQNKKTKGVL